MKRPDASPRLPVRIRMAVLAFVVFATACGGAAERAEPAATASPSGPGAGAAQPVPATPAVPDPTDAVLGFEDPSSWAASAGTTASTEVRTQGAAALALVGAGKESELTSHPVASTAAALAGLGDAGASLALDVLLPARSGGDGNGGHGDGDEDGDDDDRDDAAGGAAGTAQPLAFSGGHGGSRGGDGGHGHGDGHGGGHGDGEGHGGGDGHGHGHEGGGDGHGDGEDHPSVELRVTSPSRGLDRVSLGRISLGDVRRGIYTTLRFRIPGEVREKLGAAAFDDLVFAVHLRASRPSPGPWSFDNLRVHSPAAPLPGAGRSVNLLAVLSYAPPSSAPGEATFPVGLVQIPTDLHVKRGRAGHGSAELELGFGTGAFTTCTFRATRHGDGYRLRSCTGGPRAGDLVAADHARLTLSRGDSRAGPTKVLAQLAVNPVGDTAGAGVIPAMPTFWGDTPEESSAIATRYFDRLNRRPKTEERWITAPVPDFALRHGDGSPHDNLTGPPPPNDPPFDMEGHLNDGGNWDGYWRLAGSLVGDNSANRAKTHFDADLSTHGVVWGHDVEVASVQTTIDTDYGQLDNGLAGSSATGGLHLYLFGVEVAGGPFSSGSSIAFDLGDTATFELPPVDIWIFSVTIGVNGGVSAKGSGAISPAGMLLLVTPKAFVGAHLEGGVNIVIASGSVAADIDLIAVDTPLRAQAGWVVSTAPDVCSASLGLNLDGDLHLTSLGGTVTLKATFGICPFCDHESWPIFSWDGLDLGTVPLFHVAGGFQVFPLPQSLCTTPLVVKIEWPPGGQDLVAGIPYALHGRATPSPTPANPFPADADCSALEWSTDQPSDVQVSGGCEPIFVFDPARLGARTISLHAEDAFGETGDATPVAVDIVAPAPGLQAYITAPSPVVLAVGGNKSQTVPLHFVGAATGASSAATFSWTARLAPTGTPVPIGTGPEIDWAPGFLNTEGTWTFDITLTVTDGASTASATVQASYFVLL